jgi:L-asparaginase
MLDLDLINGRDMTVESCVTKLAFLMARGLRGQRLKTLMETDLRGELTPNAGHVPYGEMRWE